jgi:hypothetical protein
MGKKSGSRSGMNNAYHISKSLETIFWVKIFKFFYADPGSEMEKFVSEICDKHPEAATLPVFYQFFGSRLGISGPC